MYKWLDLDNIGFDTLGSINGLNSLGRIIRGRVRDLEIFIEGDWKGKDSVMILIVPP